MAVPLFSTAIQGSRRPTYRWCACLQPYLCLVSVFFIGFWSGDNYSPYFGQFAEGHRLFRATIGFTTSKTVMVLEPRDRQGLVEFCEICDALDVVGSVALNARQPAPSAAGGTGIAQVSAPSEKQPDSAGTADAARGTSPKASLEANASPSAELSVHKQAGETGRDRAADAKGSAVERTPEAANDGGSSQLPVDSAPASLTSACEVATLQQVLRTKGCNLALVSDVDEQLLLNISFKQPVRVSKDTLPT